MIKSPDIFLIFSVHGKIQKHPVKPGRLVPLTKMRKFAAHKNQLFSGMGIHIRHICTQIGKLIVIVTRHLFNKRAFAMYHLVVRQRQNKILGKCI